MPKSSESTAAPTFDMQLGGETRTLQYGFRAFKALGVNPFRPGEVAAFGQALNVDKASEWVRAGLLWEYAKDQPRYGQEPPTVEDLIDQLDYTLFDETFHLSVEAAGLTVKETDPPSPESAGSTADPQ